MGLSRLDNFLKSVRGNIIYVDPNSLDATDSIENQGNSLTRPFKTIQRALIESSRFSYQQGLNNDRFAKTTILLYPGDHIVDNRPGWTPDGSNNFRLRNGSTSNDFPPFDLTSRFDLTDSNNQLYKFNSVYGGVIIPRGTSIVGFDLRKTKIRPLYVPNPVNNNIERSCIFRLTGGSYLWQFSIFDADPNGNCYVDYTSNTFVPNFSHHKLSCFEYADGVNPVDVFQTYTTDRTDLEMYYEKVGLAYGQSSGRAISPDYPSAGVDIQPKIDEYRIVGSTGETTGISSIRAGNGAVSSNIITVTTVTPVSGLDVDTPFRINGITGYNGQFVVVEKISDTQLTYRIQNPPANPLPSPIGGSLSLTSDTVTSASPYIFNISVRSVFGMCGLLADGNKATGFKSMMVAQFTGIGLQKDDNAFVKYNTSTGIYDTSASIPNLHVDSRAIFKPEYRNFHIKAINDAFVQNVSVFAIGYAEHFVVENGGDMSITNSNSNFGSKALSASGFRNTAFPQDDQGYITHIIPPKEFSKDEIAVEFSSIDVNATVGVASIGNLYLYNQINQDVVPENVLEGYRIGARENDELKLVISTGGTPVEYCARIVMPNSQTSSEKSFNVGRSTVGINSIISNTLTLTSPHTFQNGESIRILSENGQLPDGLVTNNVYYAITNTGDVGIGTNQVKIAKTVNDAISLNPVVLNNRGGRLSVVSRVSDKNSGDIGHPIQFDTTRGQWFVRVATASSENNIYSAIVSLGSAIIGEATPRTYINRLVDNRNVTDTIYRVRYVIPSTSNARPPSDGFIIQESSSTLGATNSEIQSYFGSGDITENQLRNPKFIANTTWSTNIVTVTTELPHNLTIGSQVEILNVRSTNNTSATENRGFNGTFTVTSIGNSKQFSYALITDPGTFTSDTTTRTTALPHFRRKKFNNTYYVYRTEESQRYIAGEQDGIYYLTLVNASNAPVVSPFENEKFAQPVKELFPQVNRDNPVADPEEAKSFASSSLIGEVIINDVRKSITKETLNKTLTDSDVGIGLTDIRSLSATNHTIFTSYDHGLNRIAQVSLTNPGAGYGPGVPGDYYNATLVGFAGSTVGQFATAKVTLDGAGSITNVKIMDGGSAYGIGNTLTVTGIGTTTGFSTAVVTVSNVYNNVGDVVKISGITSTAYQDYNNLYRITEVNVGSAKSFRAVSATSVSGVSTTVGPTFTANSILYVTGEAIRVNTFAYNNVTGIATITSVNRHGLRVDNKILITGANESLYNGEFIVTKNTSLTSFNVRIGVSTSAPTATGTLFVYREGFASNEGLITRDNENLNGRMVPTYAGITTTLSALVSDATTDQVSILNSQNLDINIGDYLSINDEIVRVKRNTSSTPSPIFVIRGVLGTRATNHPNNSVVRRIHINPIELRRHSIMRASGHTFEYVGYGPGNYSTAFPDKQDRQISPQEELLAQSTRKDGGVNFYTGMNDKGVSYSGNKRLSSVTGQEEIFDTPIQTVTGEDIGNLPGLNIINSVEGIFSRSITVEGGVDGKALSSFTGPVVFTNKVKSNSSEGIEAISLFLQGNASISRKFTVGTSIPSLAGNPGDVVYNAEPDGGENIGWVYTRNNKWESFGQISVNNVPSTNTIGIFSGGSLLGASQSVNFVGTGGITVSGTYNSTAGISTLTFNASITSPTQLSVSGISTFNGVTIFNAPVAFNSSITAGTISASSLSATNISFTNLTGPSIGIATFTATNANFDGNIILGNISKASDTFVRVLSGDNNVAGIEAYGNSQGTGYLFVGESSTNGGGVFYNGNGIPTFATGETTDTIAFYRKNAGTNEVVFSYPNNSNTVTFRGSVSATSFSAPGGLNVAGTISATSFSSPGGLTVVGVITCTDLNTTSDKNLKYDIRKVENSISLLNEINGVEFKWKSNDKPSIGVIAQEVEKVLPELIGGGETKSVNYNGLIGVLIEAVKTQQTQIDELNSRIDRLENN
jgi:hypothetical protein